MDVLNEELARRLRATRPPLDGKPDPALLARAMAQPRPRASRTRLIAPALTLAAAGALAFALLAGGPQTDSASAIEQALRWFDPPAGQILHTRLVDEHGAQEFWGNAQDYEGSRVRITRGRSVYETSGGALYEAATNTIYEPSAGREGAAPQPPRPERVELQPGDPTVSKVRTLLSMGRAEVRGHEIHDGQDAWAIALEPSVRGNDDWTLWVSSDDGKPIALDDGGESVRWTTYELAPAGTPLTLTAAHPDARVVRDSAEYQAARDRLGLGKRSPQ